MTTVATLITRIRYRLYEPKGNLTGESDSLFFKDSELIEYINDAIADLCEDTEVNFKQYTYTTGASASSWQISTLVNSAELIELYNIYYHLTTDSDTTYRPLLKQDVTDLKLYGNDNTIFMGQVYDGMLYLNRANTIGDEFIINGKFAKTILTSTADTFPLDKLCETAVLFYVTALGFYKREKFDSGDKWMMLYQDKKNKITQHAKKLIRTDSPDGMLVYKNVDFGYEQVQFPITE